MLLSELSQFGCSKIYPVLSIARRGRMLWFSDPECRIADLGPTVNEPNYAGKMTGAHDKHSSETDAICVAVRQCSNSSNNITLHGSSSELQTIFVSLVLNGGWWHKYKWNTWINETNRFVIWDTVLPNSIEQFRLQTVFVFLVFNGGWWHKCEQNTWLNETNKSVRHIRHYSMTQHRTVQATDSICISGLEWGLMTQMWVEYMAKWNKSVRHIRH